MRKSVQKSFVLLLSLVFMVLMVPTGVSAAGIPSVSYQTHIENIGWEADAGIGLRSNGEASGTYGRSLRLEGIKINLDTQGYDLGVSYQTHIQNIGWESDAGIGWQSNGNMSGTYGRSLRLEAIQIKLTGSDADKFDIYYQVHAENIGWMGWAKNGESAGTAGYSYRLEAIKIQIVPKGADAPGSTENAYQEYVKPKYKEAYADLINQAYKEFVDKYATGSYKWVAKYAAPYSLFDMDSDGIPELFIEKGNCEANYEYYIYTFENGKPKYVGATSGGHVGLYGETSSAGGNLILLQAHMGHQWIFNLNYINGTIERNLISEAEIPFGSDYTRTDFPVPSSYAYDLTLLNSF